MSFQTIKNVATSHGWCSGCNQPTKRQRTFEALVHPNNRRKDGAIKTPAEVRAEVLEWTRKWQPNHDHQNCPAIRAERVARRLKRSKA